MKRKLRSSGGFTLMESLAALAILTIMLTALVAGTSASVTVYKQSTALSEANVLSSTLFETISDELRFATAITTTGGDLHTFTSLNYGANASFINEDGRVKISAGALSHDLIGQKVYTGLAATADITYSSGSFSVIVSVTDPKQDFAECNRAEFSITRLNP